MGLPSLSQKLPHVTGLRCVICGREYGLEEVEYTCPVCGPVGTLDVLYDYRHAQKRQPTGDLNMWWQRDLLPISGEPPVELHNLGGTPLIEYKSLNHVAREFDVAGVCIKNDGQSLTGSLKDRASAMVVTHAMQNLHKHIIALASTGNAAAALAGCCAAVRGAKASIIAPQTAPEAKVAQMLVYGAKVILIDATYDAAFDLCWECCEEFGWYNRSTGINPFTTEGKKTVTFEVAEQLGWKMPDVILVPVGDGSIIGGVHKGCLELYNLGWIDKLPRLIGVQAAGSDSMVYAWENTIAPVDMTIRQAETIADSISSHLPHDRAKAMRAVRETGGAFMRVSDDEILKGLQKLARASGVFAEPAAAAVYAALGPARERGYIEQDDKVMLLITGNGLKDVKSALKTVTHRKPTISPTIEAVREHIEGWFTTH